VDGKGCVACPGHPGSAVRAAGTVRPRGRTCGRSGRAPASRCRSAPSPRRAHVGAVLAGRCV